ncbi:2-oxo acid dehydrogenase subunit E2, partial [bacterium]|nr:2-oxo acid dehydrogenase subunit E2 [bacterium]
MMAKKVVLSNLGVDITEAIIGSLVRQEGEKVKRGDVIALVESQKVSFEVVSPADGFLLKILCKEGDTVKVGETVAIVGKEGEDISSLLEKGLPEKQKSDKVKIKLKKEIFTKTEKIHKVKAYPAARKLAQELNLDLSQIEGTDSGGLITKKDVERYFKKQGISEVIPLRGTRATIARNMVESLQTAAHVTTAIEIDMTLVKSLREEFRKKKNLKLSYLPFIIKAAVKAIQDVSIINSIIRENKIIKKKEVNFGIAISTKEALLVPVIHYAETMDLIKIYEKLEKVTILAREKKLTPEDMQGGTITLSNGGVFGPILNTPIINQPQV